MRLISSSDSVPLALGADIPQSAKDELAKARHYVGRSVYRVADPAPNTSCLREFTVDSCSIHHAYSYIRVGVYAQTCTVSVSVRLEDSRGSLLPLEQLSRFEQAVVGREVGLRRIQKLLNFANDNMADDTVDAWMEIATRAKSDELAIFTK